MSGGLRLRPAVPSDLPACERVWRLGIDGYAVRLNQPPTPDENPALRRLHAHTLATDPDRFWVAVRDGDGPGTGEVAAFASAVQRGDLWFLSMLFVSPEVQGGGTGRALMERVGPAGSGGDAGGTRPVRGIVTDALQPISNALYASTGVVPRMPMWRIVGDADTASRLPRLPDGIGWAPLEAGLVATADVPDVDGLDLAVSGIPHAADRAYLVADGRRGFAYRDGSGHLVGYGYASEAGRVGPVAVEDPALLAPVLGHLLAAIPPRGGAAAWVPGAAGDATTALLRAGFRIDGFPLLLCWDRPFADFSRYLPISPGLL